MKPTTEWFFLCPEIGEGGTSAFTLIASAKVRLRVDSGQREMQIHPPTPPE
jgi:hypothetical protein